MSLFKRENRAKLFEFKLLIPVSHNVRRSVLLGIQAGISVTCVRSKQRVAVEVQRKQEHSTHELHDDES